MLRVLHNNPAAQRAAPRIGGCYYVGQDRSGRYNGPRFTRSQPTRTKQGNLMNALLICSGGFDSVTLAYRLAAEQSLGTLLTFDYGQRHRKEIHAARLAAERLAGPHLLMDIGHIGGQTPGRGLTDGIAGLHGHYSEEHQKG